MIRMLLEAEEQLIIDEDFIIEEDEEPGNMYYGIATESREAWEGQNRKLQKYKLYYTHWPRDMIDMIYVSCT